MAKIRVFQCSDCEHSWEEPYGTGRPTTCPACQGSNIRRAEGDAAQDAGRRRRGRHGQGGGRGRGKGHGKGGQDVTGAFAVEPANTSEEASGQ